MASFHDLSQDDQVERLRDVAVAALDAYSLTGARLEFVEYSNNLFFRVDAQEGRYALRVCRAGFDLGDLRRETHWLAALGSDTDLAVAAVLAADDGSLYVEAGAPGVPEPRYCVLFRWLEGRHLSDELTPAHLHSLGKYVGTLHLHSETYRPPEELLSEVWTGDTLAEDFPLEPFEAVYGASDITVIAGAVRRAGETMQAIGVGRKECGLIHTDLHQMNYMFDGVHARAIDFEAPSRMCYLYDIAVTLAYLRDMPMPMTYEVPRTLYDALAGAYYEGYAEARALPEQYAERVEILKTLKLLSVAQWIASSPNIRRMAWTERYVRELPGILRRLLDG
ncbi:hypothetical protein CMK11_01765 [Candidatus Poribacteria bacterium]|nr:hypothetical protein [Candidatus Poribacteria bacterium]